MPDVLSHEVPIFEPRLRELVQSYNHQVRLAFIAALVPAVWLWLQPKLFSSPAAMATRIFRTSTRPPRDCGYNAGIYRADA
jgi:hypothetical protein